MQRSFVRSQFLICLGSSKSNWRWLLLRYLLCYPCWMDPDL